MNFKMTFKIYTLNLLIFAFIIFNTEHVRQLMVFTHKRKNNKKIPYEGFPGTPKKINK